MFDYQAGEKFKLTLIMVAFAGLMAGVFFTMLLMPPQDNRPSKRVANQRYMSDPDITGGRRSEQAYGNAQAGAAQAMSAPQQAQAPGAPVAIADPNTALSLIESWLPSVWDLSAGSAKASQEKAILYMTADCAAAYKQNIWTPDLAKQIEESGLQSTFNAKKVSAGQNQEDGSIVIYVEGEQVLQVPGKPTRARPVKLEYLVKQTADGMRIAGISEGSHT